MNDVNNVTLGHPNKVSLSGRADPQRNWEGPRRSLTVVLCEFLSKPVFFLFCAPFFYAAERELRLTEMIDHRKTTFSIIRNSNVPCQVRPQPSVLWPTSLIRLDLHLFFSFQLHANHRAQHNYTLQEKKKAALREGPGFDGELNDFQAPQLSSLAKLVSISFLFGYCCVSQATDDSECCDQNMNDTVRL